MPDYKHPIRSTGPCLPTLATTFGNTREWAMPERLTREDRRFTVMNVSKNPEYNDYLVASGPFVNEPIPNDAIILRITIATNVHSATNRASEEVYWSFYGLRVDGSEPGLTKNRANYVTIVSTNYASEAYDISSYTPDEWGFPGLTGAQIKDPTFGLALRFRSTNDLVIVSMDFVSFTVFWVSPDVDG